jgi:nucleolar protein 53
MSSRPSRKGTKAWRKNVDISHEENQLEELRKEEILGGKLYEKPSAAIFTVDTLGDQRMMKAIKQKTLRIDDIVKPKSGIPAITRNLRPTFVKVHGMELLNGKDVKNSIVKARNVSKQQNLKLVELANKKKKLGLGVGSTLKLKAASRIQKKKEVKIARGGYDMWDIQTEVVNPYLEPALKKPVRKPVVKDQRPKGIPAVVVVHSGGSYQPSEKDHKDLINMAAEEEFEKIERKEKLDQNFEYPKELDLLVLYN